MEIERESWIFLNQIADLTPRWFQRLLKAAGSAASIREMTASTLRAAGVPEIAAERWAAAFRSTVVRRAFEAERERESKGLARVLTELDPGYPESLRELSDRPPVLYTKGMWPWPEQIRLAVVGTRHPSRYGLRAAHYLTTGFSEASISIISGLASGIDTEAHRAALATGGFTVAVLGHGLGHVYPNQNRKLFEQIGEEGALITEFPFDTAPHALHFPQRNRIIAGLVRGVVVVEAGRRSGALITARLAAEQGRDVFAVPGSIFEAASAGSHFLLKEGAKPVIEPGDILEEYDSHLEPAAGPETHANKRHGEKNESTLDSLERQVLNELKKGAVSLDELVASLALPIDQLAEALLSLELRSFIETRPGQRYALSDH